MTCYLDINNVCWFDSEFIMSKTGLNKDNFMTNVDMYVSECNRYVDYDDDTLMLNMDGIYELMIMYQTKNSTTERLIYHVGKYLPNFIRNNINSCKEQELCKQKLFAELQDFADKELDKELNEEDDEDDVDVENDKTNMEDIEEDYEDDDGNKNMDEGEVDDEIVEFTSDISPSEYKNSEKNQEIIVTTCDTLLKTNTFIIHYPTENLETELTYFENNPEIFGLPKDRYYYCYIFKCVNNERTLNKISNILHSFKSEHYRVGFDIPFGALKSILEHIEQIDTISMNVANGVVFDEIVKEISDY